MAKGKKKPDIVATIKQFDFDNNPPPPAENLSPRHRFFVLEYLKNLNATQAYRAVYPNSKNPDVDGHKLLVNPRIQEAINDALEDRARRSMITADMVLVKLYQFANLDLGQAYDDKGNLLNVADMPEEVRSALLGVEVLQEFDGTGKDRYQMGVTTKIKIESRIKALELIGRHLKMFTDKLELHDNRDLAERIRKGRGRVGKKEE